MPDWKSGIRILLGQKKRLSSEALFWAGSRWMLTMDSFWQQGQYLGLYISKTLDSFSGVGIPSSEWMTGIVICLAGLFIPIRIHFGA